jgi:hypothetical protein
LSINCGGNKIEEIKGLEQKKEKKKKKSAPHLTSPNHQSVSELS